MTKKGYLNPRFRVGNDPRDRILNSENSDKFIRIGKVVRVDHEAYTVDIIYIDSIGAELNVPVSQGMIGTRSFLGGMPSENDICLIGYSKSGGLSSPIIIGFLPMAYGSAIRNDIMGVPETYADIYQPIRPKMKKIYEGELFISSSFGSDIHLDKNIILSNSDMVEFILKSADKSIHSSALNHFLNSAGVRIASGPIHRNALLNDPEYRYPNVEFPIYINNDGSSYYTPVLTSLINNSFPYGKETINDNAVPFIEHRVEVKEYDDPNIPVTSSNSGVDFDSFYKKNSDGTSNKPIAIQVLGTLVGNDPNGDRDKYGTILKPVLFSDPNSFKGQLSEIPCVAGSGINETTTLAAAYALKFPNSGTAFYVNKQGKYIANISASSSIDPMGSGESAEINLQGHTKMFMGKNVEKSRSLSLSTAGGVYTNWGFDNDKKRSWDASFRKGVSWNILGSDSDGNALNMKIQGDVRVDIEGSRYTEIRGSDVRLVHGIIEDKYLGKKVNQYVTDVNNTYGSKYIEMTVGHHNQTFSSGISRTIVAPDLTSGSKVAESTEIKAGDSSHKMLLGNRSDEILIGNHTSKIGLGNRSINITTGNYAVKVTAGNVDIKTSLGNVNVKATGQVTIDGSLGVMIKSAVKVTVEAPMVDIGKMKPLQGIVTGGPRGHKDYLTGLPLIGAFSVKSSAT